MPKILPVFGAILNFGIKESPDKVSMRIIEKLTLENVVILSLGGTEPEIHLGGHLPPPNCKVRLENTIATLGLRYRFILS